MKVLIAVDDDEESRDALEFAEPLLPPAAEVLVVNVARSTVTPYVLAGFPDSTAETIAVDDPATQAIVDAAARDLVEGSARRLVADISLDAEVLVSHGEPGPTICALATEHAIDLIVLGTHDRSAWGRFWYGSVSDHVVHHAPCSVLVVK